MNLDKGIKKGSMREVVAGIYDILRSDEELMRLLVYPSESINIDILHPMDEDLANIVPKDKNGKIIFDELYWERVDKHIMLAEKSSNIEKEAIVRLYIYPGRRRPQHRNYLLSKQEVIIDVLMHESFAGDMRLEWINDRINELLSLERVQGVLGMLDYAQGNPREAPIGYSRYQHVFVFGTGKK